MLDPLVVSRDDCAPPERQGVTDDEGPEAPGKEDRRGAGQGEQEARSRRQGDTDVPSRHEPVILHSARGMKLPRRVPEEQLDRLAALGMVSVFDVEEVGAAVLAEELEITVEQADQMVELASAKAKVVAEEQQREKEVESQRRAEEMRLASSVLDGVPSEERSEAALGSEGDGAAQAASILGLGRSVQPAAAPVAQPGGEEAS